MTLTPLHDFFRTQLPTPTRLSYPHNPNPEITNVTAVSLHVLFLFRCCFISGAVSFQVLIFSGGVPFQVLFLSHHRRGTTPWWKLDAFPLRSWKGRLADLKSVPRTESKDKGGLRDPLGTKRIEKILKLSPHQSTFFPMDIALYCPNPSRLYTWDWAQCHYAFT